MARRGGKPPQPAKRDLRERVSEILDELGDDEVRDILRGGLAADRRVYVDVTCKNKHCGKTYRYPIVVPDWDKRAKVLEILLTQAKGKPDVAKRPERPSAAKPLEAMTLAELEAEEARLLKEFPDLAD